MPMLYVAQHGGNFVEKATSPEDIIYIACSLERIISNGNEFYFNEGVNRYHPSARTATTCYFDCN